MITFSVADYNEDDKNVEVTYFNDENFVYKRFVNIPHLEDGTINETYFDEILNGQLSGVINKLSCGVIQFVDPNSEVGIQTS